MFMTVKKFLQLFSPGTDGTRSLRMGWRSVACRLVLQNLLSNAGGGGGEAEERKLWKQKKLAKNDLSELQFILKISANLN